MFYVNTVYFFVQNRGTVGERRFPETHSVEGIIVERVYSYGPFASRDKAEQFAINLAGQAELLARLEIREELNEGSPSVAGRLDDSPI